jgi:hypothetical protein
MSEPIMTVMGKVSALKKQVETLESFLRSNPFLKGAQDESPTLTDFDDNCKDVFIVTLRRNDRQVRFYTNWDDRSISARSEIETISFVPTDTETVIRFLKACGYFNGHDAMAALKESAGGK